MKLQKQILALSIGVETATTAITSLIFKPGRPAVIPSWDIQPTAQVGDDLTTLSQAGIDASSWHHIGSSKCTLMGCLIEAGVYSESELFYSQNLKTFDASQFHEPWLYRHEFKLKPSPGQHYLLQTHGITSKADIFLNGNEVANSSYQAGAYVGRTYDISRLVEERNALVIRVYPTDYNYDFALGFVDWNPYPPDNGTGVWRDVEIKQTGPVALGPLRVHTETSLPIRESSARVTLKATVQNLEDRDITINTVGSVSLEGSDVVHDLGPQPITLAPLQTVQLNISTTLKKPAIWWPKAWGDQPLYTGRLSVSVNGTDSDIVERTFGIRQVTSEVNTHDDTIFSVNGHPFQVVGGGYSADMFLRWDSAKFTAQAKLMLDLGHNTIRFEGKNEHPELYEIADRLGMMVMAGWECCDKWEAWTYNEDLAVKAEWTEDDYVIANGSMLHEALMQQSHPAILAYLIGSDFWPDDKATQMYLDSFKESDWQTPIIASASKRGYPELLGSSGMKMEGPYDWVPPNYWYDVEPSEERLGAAFGFGSELGAGVGTPEISSLKKFLSDLDLEDLWKQPKKGLYHMSTEVSSFYTREIYNDALWKRYGTPSSLEDYLLKAQIMDYEATRAQFEGFSAKWSAERPATGLIYWMLNNAWPSLHWNLFDYYLHPAGSYFGAKVGARTEHLAYDYFTKEVYLINHSIDHKGPRTLAAEVIDIHGRGLFHLEKPIETEPNTSKSVLHLSNTLSNMTEVFFLRLILSDGRTTLSRNVYWLTKTTDTLDWENSTWYHTPVTNYIDFSALNNLKLANVSTNVSRLHHRVHDKVGLQVVLENHSAVPAFFIRLNLVDHLGGDVLPVFWSDNYVTLWPNEKLELHVEGANAAAIQISGKNIQSVNEPL